MLGLDCFEMAWNVDVYCIVIWIVILPCIITFDYNIKHQDELGRDGLLQDISKMHLETFWFACLSSNNIIASNNRKKCTTLERVEEHLKGKRRALVNCRQGRSRAPALCALHSYSLQPLPPPPRLFTIHRDGQAEVVVFTSNWRHFSCQFRMSFNRYYSNQGVHWMPNLYS